MPVLRFIPLIALSLTLTGCSTGTVDRELFAHTADDTYQRVRTAVPLGTRAESARTTMTQAGWTCGKIDKIITKSNGPTRSAWNVGFECWAMPSFGGYPFSKEYWAAFIVRDGRVYELEVNIHTPEA